MSYHENETYTLAAEISQLSKDYDYYEFSDTFESEEESVQATYELLLHEEGVKSLLLFCEDILSEENEYEDLKPQAKKLHEKLKSLKQ